MINTIFGIVFGALCVAYGVLVILNPMRFALNSLNDKLQKWIFGEKAYVILARYIGGPLTVGFGILIILASLNAL